MTLNEITTLIASSYNKQFDDPFKFILMAKVDYWRVRLIRNTLEKNPKDRKFFKQHIYVPMVRKLLTPCVNNCEIAMSTQQVPAPIRVNEQLFDYVGAIDGNNAFQEVQIGMMTYVGKYSKKFLKYSYENRYIKVFGNPNIPAIRIDGIFENATDLIKYQCSQQGANCNIWDMEYPITQEILQLVVSSILAEGVKLPDETEVPVIK